MLLKKTSIIGSLTIVILLSGCQSLSQVGQSYGQFADNMNEKFNKMQTDLINGSQTLERAPNLPAGLIVHLRYGVYAGANKLIGDLTYSRYCKTLILDAELYNADSAQISSAPLVLHDVKPNIKVLIEQFAPSDPQRQSNSVRKILLSNLQCMR
ncbi:MAG: hypothetical protein KGO49_07005 [Gammaproteobacteria bacterium]|nr:hypothetical protein [Gammaproteobacteria bacterium]